MNVELKGQPSFTHLVVSMEPGEGLNTESGAMASSDAGIDMETGLKGGVIASLLRKLFGGESLFQNTFINRASVTQTMVVSKETPGDIFEYHLNGENLFLQPGAYLASTPGIELKLKWAGFRYLIGGEGLFRLQVSGNGKVWIGVFGVMVQKELKGEYIVDSGHLVAYPPSVKYSLQLSGGLISSFTSGEGFVGRLEGHGQVLLQTRSFGGLVGWLNPRLPN